MSTPSASKARDTTSAIARAVESWGLRKGSAEFHDKSAQVNRWLSNFAPDEQPDALSLLPFIQVKRTEDIEAIIQSLAQQLIKFLGARLGDALFFPLGNSAASSGSQFMFPFRKALSIEEAAFPAAPPAEYLSSDATLVFVDDIVGSGQQATKFSSELFKESGRRRGIYCALFGFEDGLRELRKKGWFEEVIPGVIMTDRDRAFDGNAPAIGDPQLRERLRLLASKYGEQLYPKGPLGYDDSQALIVLPHNTPNNTLPIIWAGPQSESEPTVPWNPIWARKKVVIPYQRSTRSPMKSRASVASLLRKPQGFEEVFPFDRTLIVDLFIEPRYMHELYKLGEKEGPWAGSSFRADAERIAKTDNACLVLSGPFGSGKTFLAKYLCLTGALGPQDHVVVVTARQLAEHLRATGDRWSNVIQSSGIHALVIDAFDELLIDASGKPDSVVRCLKFASAALKEGAPVVITLRVSDANSMPETARKLSDVLFDHDVYDIHFLRLEPFTKPQVAEWLDNYSGQRPEATEVLTTATINRLHKRLITATQIPLFLYMLAHSYYRRGLAGIDHIYGIYEEFLSATTSGRFRPNEDSALGATWALSAAYEQLLEGVASAINNSRHLRQAEQSSEDDDLEWLLDENRSMYAIPLSDVQRVISKNELKLLEEKEGGPHSQKNLTVQVLNNYFFARSGGHIGFKDNNILFFLVARRLYQAISGLISAADPDVDRQLRVISETKGHPQAIEILLKRFDKDGPERRRELAVILQQLISQGRIIQITTQSLESISAATINRDIVLSLVLLHVKRRYSDMEYFLTRLAWLTSAVKVHDAMYRHLIARFFRRITLEDLEFRRLNCDEFNFSNSQFNQVAFIQCKLFGARFSNCSMHDTSFTLCDFGPSSEVCDFSRMSGQLKLSHCVGGEIRIQNLESDITIEIERCSFSAIRIECASLSSRIAVVLKAKNCSIRHLFFENAYLRDADLRGTTIESLSDKNSKGRLLVDRWLSPKWAKRTGSVELVAVEE